MAGRRITALLFLAGTAAFAAAFASSTDAEPKPLRLALLGEARQLPPRVLGASAEPLIEHLLDDGRKRAAVKATGPAVLRFPGGSQANYYDWRTGLLQFDASAGGSAYMKFWAAAAPKIARAFPGGVHLEQFAPFAAEVGADTILVPNLETSSVAEQVAWFRDLAAKRILPRDIELGNEFWVAMGGDPAVMRKWPDAPMSMAVMQRYEQALRPIVGAGAKFAVQAAAASYFLPSGQSAFARRLRQWDEDLKPGDWYEAVTAHLYPGPERIAARAGNPTRQALLALLMGRSDAGTDRVLDDLGRRLPGKEIWVTEWSPRGGTAPTSGKRTDLVSPAMMVHLVARQTLAMLRHPAMTRALFFTLNAMSGTPWQAYVQVADGFEPLPETAILGWFNDAANGGSTFQRVIDQDDAPVIGLGELRESYRPIEGAVFGSARRRVLILQNASATARAFDPTERGAAARPSLAEILIAANFDDVALRAAVIDKIDASGPVVLPAWSVARFVWE